jgi:hypothetical protein
MRAARPGSIAVLSLALTLTAHALRAQTGTPVTCNDGTKSTTSGRGACSGHGGVSGPATGASAKATKGADKSAQADAKSNAKRASAATKRVEKDEKSAAKADAKATKSASNTVAAETKAEDKADKNAAGATAQCKDGTYSHAKSTRGACSGHGGVAKSLKP